MTLTSNNPRITNVELTGNMDFLTYFVDGRLVEVCGEMSFITDRITREYTGIRETALVRDPRCYNADGTLNEMVEELPNDGVLEEIDFEAYFNE